METDKFREECGICGIYGHPEASNLVYLGLYALQHRGQESAGIASSNGDTLHIEKAMGLVAEVFTQDRLKKLPGEAAIGHVRYSTTGSSHIKNAQPIVVTTRRGPVSLAHNGNLINAAKLRTELESEGALFSSTTDSEVILHLIARSKPGDLLEATAEALSQVRGAYSLLVMNNEELIAIRDPYGLRPLSLGKLKGAWVLASESCAFDLIEAKFVRDLEPGEFLRITKQGINSYFLLPPALPSPCVFEYIYFSRPDSLVFGQSVYQVRRELGRRLAKETAIEADLVIPVPDSGTSAALGYAQESGIPFEYGLIRNHYVGRTFIEPRQAIRHFGVKVKLNAMREVLEGKRVIVVDDSIVRGTTSRKIVTMVRGTGAREVHMRISSPPIKSPCYYGIDTPTRKELIAATHRVEEIRRYIGADTLEYLSIKGLQASVKKKDGFCMACFTGEYPIEFPWEEKAQLVLFEKC